MKQWMIPDSIILMGLKVHLHHSFSTGSTDGSRKIAALCTGRATTWSRGFTGQMEFIPLIGSKFPNIVHWIHWMDLNTGFSYGCAQSSIAPYCTHSCTSAWYSSWLIFSHHKSAPTSASPASVTCDVGRRSEDDNSGELDWDGKVQRPLTWELDVLWKMPHV